jgi:ubiquinone/menaquinone biosynthesis C-methylase UbiE
MSGIHRAAAEGFSRSAEAYERGRPEYPDAAIEHVVELMRPGATVLDLAAGTGKLTRPLVAAGLRVVAVEPVPEMRAALPGALEGTAEAIPLGDGSVDAVTVGQAFHWFDGDAALAEIARVLRPGGLLALVWNRRVDTDPLNKAIEELVAPYRGDTPGHRGPWRAAFDRTSAFTPLEEAAFEHPVVQDADSLEARVGSISFIAALDPAERAGVLERARAIAGDGEVTIPYRTEVLTCRRV